MFNKILCQGLVFFSGASQPESEDYDSEDNETAQEKKIRLTKQYLAQLKEEGTYQ